MRCRLRVEGLEDRLAPATLIVNTLADDSTADDSLSLREAIQVVNSQSTSGLSSEELAQISGTLGANDTIRFADTVAGGTVQLTTVGDTSFGPSAFVVAEPLTIDGGTPGMTLHRDVATPFRHFTVNSGVSLTLENLTLSNGLAKGGDGGGSTSGGPGGGAAGLGGAIFNQGTLTIGQCDLTGNTAQGGNGGSGNSGTRSGGGGGGLAGNGTDGAPHGVYISGGTGGGPNGGSGGTLGTNGLPGGTGGGGGGGGYDDEHDTGGASGGMGGFGGGGGGAANGRGFGGNGGFGGGGGAGLGVESSVGGSGGFAGGFAGANFEELFGGGGGGAGLGGAIFSDGGSVTITGAIFSSNSARGGAGGSGRSTHFAAGGSGFGGAIFIRNGELTLIGDSFTNNTATAGSTLSEGKGGAIYVLHDGVNGSATATATTTTSFNGNSASQAGNTTTNPQDNNDVFGTLTVASSPPTVTVPGAQIAYEDVDKAIGGITVGDVDSASLTVTLSVCSGTLTLGPAGQTVSGSSVTLTGTIDYLNTMLATLVYRGSLNFSGIDSLQIDVSDGSLSTLGSVDITVKSWAQQTEELSEKVDALVAAGVLNEGQGNALNLNLKGNNGDAGKVQAFLNQVQAFLQAGILAQDQADPLLELGNILLLSVTRK